MRFGVPRRVTALQRLPLRLALGYLAVGILWIFVSDRVLSAVLRDADEITRVQTYKGWAYITVTGVLLYFGAGAMVRAMVQTRGKLRASRLDYQQLVETMHDGVWISDPGESTVFVNGRMAELLGAPREQLLRDGPLRYLDPSTPLPPSGPDARAPQLDYELRFNGPDGRVAWTLVAQSPILSPEGECRGTLRVVMDNTRHKREKEILAETLHMQRLLVEELNHRVRNNLASLITIVSESAHTRADVRAFAAAVVSRLRAMAAAHSLLASAGWSAVPMGSVVGAITGKDGDRVAIQGPDVMVPSDRVMPLALVVHELIANAEEHGALKAAGGSVSISWTVVGEERGRVTGTGHGPPEVILEWVEHGGPPMTGDPARGFGLQLAEGVSRSDLGGSLEMRFTRAGVSATLVFTLPEQTQAYEMPEEAASRT